MTNTPSDAEVVEVLATKGMHFTRDVFIPNPDGPWEVWRYPEGGVAYAVVRGSASCFVWDPLTSHDQIYEIEKRLSADQRRAYLVSITALLMEEEIHSRGLWKEWEYRHASARTCALALWKVLRDK